MKSAWKTIVVVLKVVGVVAVAALIAGICLAIHRSIVEERAFVAKAEAKQTVMPQDRIYIDPHREVRIREMPLGSRGWTIAEAILVGKGGRCFLDLNERVELNVRPDLPRVELHLLKDGIYEATVLDSCISWKPSNVTGSERGSSREMLYFPLRVSFSDSQKADAR